MLLLDMQVASESVSYTAKSKAVSIQDCLGAAAPSSTGMQLSDMLAPMPSPAPADDEAAVPPGDQLKPPNVSNALHSWSRAQELQKAAYLHAASCMPKHKRQLIENIGLRKHGT